MHGPISFQLGSAWHIIYTHIKNENRVELGLRSKGFEVYLPRAKRWICHARIKKEVTFPLFSRYLFVSFDIEKDEWFNPIMTTDGVADILRNNQIPCRVPQDIIENLKGAEDMGFFDETTELKRLEPGTEVRPIRGPFANIIGRLKNADDVDRVEIFISLFGGERVIKLPLIDLRRA